MEGAVTRPLVVLGDVLLDIDRSGTVERMSPEAPVPVLRDPLDVRRPGGAALAALLAARNGSRPVVLIAPWADDDAARQLGDLLRDRVQVIGIGWTGSTPVKTRLRAGSHPIARIDEGGHRGSLAEVPAEARAALADAAAVLVADYGVGATGFPVIRELLQGLSARTPVVWDPHPQGSAPVPGTWCVTPNERELQVLSAADAVRGAGTSVRRDYGTLATTADALAAHWRARSVCVTLGSSGALLCTPGGPPLMVPAPPVVAGDTCGAGDSFAAALATALAGGALISEAVGTAAEVAARFVADGGAAGFDASAGFGAVAPSGPLVSAPPGTTDLLTTVRRSGGTVVATGGCFDLLHAGHVATLEAARALGDCLVVLLNSDASVRRLKGSGRPLQPQQDRARVLEALSCVDAVLVFDDDTPAAALVDLQPDVWAKGGDYAGVELPEAAVIARWGGQVVTVPYLAGRSTTALVESAAVPVR